MGRWLTGALLLGLVGLVSPAAASFLQAPHDGSHGVGCVDCHRYSLRQEVWPPDYPPAAPTQDDTFRNFICLRCHGSGGSAPEVKLHSHLGMGTLSRFPGWTSQCVSCHDPHFQSQLQWLGNGALFPVTGHIDAVAVAGSEPGAITSTVTYSQAVAAGPWADVSRWSAKTGAGRGMILVPDSTLPSTTYEIAAADSNRLTVIGRVDPDMVGKTFGLLYGQLIRNRIQVGQAKMAVRFFSPEDGGFVDQSGSPPTGICQVCHQNTVHWSPVAPPDDDHFGALRCTLCHEHGTGFGPGGSNTGKHQVHLQITGQSCAPCHDLANFLDNNGNVLFADGAVLATTTVCIACHQDGRNGPAGQGDFVAGWTDPQYDLDCSACHQNQPATGSHSLHLAGVLTSVVTCGSCHDAAQQDVAPPSQHVDGTVDVYDGTAGDLGYPPDKALGTAYAACDTAYCHSDGKGNYRPMTWRDSPASLGCNQCHGVGTVSGYPNYANGGAGTELANDHDTHSEAANCFYCHYQTTQDGVSIADPALHMNTSRDVTLHPSFDSGFVYDEVSKTCSNTTCHTGAVQWGADPATVTANCGVCHATPPLDDAGTSQPHSIHFGIGLENPPILPTTYGDRQVGATTEHYGFYCGICHPTSPLQHQNDPATGSVADPKRMEISIQQAAARGGTPQYDTTGAPLATDPGVAVDGQGNPVFYYGFHAGQCDNLYCHSDGRGGPPNYPPVWQLGQAPADCTYCHGNDSASTIPMDSGGHPSHVGKAGRQCAECHAATVGDNRTIVDHTRHVSNYFDPLTGDPVQAGIPAVDVVWGGLSAGGDPYDKVGHTCANLYCHSDGTNSPVYQNVVWGAALSCNGCHGTTTTDGRPDYSTGSPKANSHDAHVLRGRLSCAVCHYGTTADGGNITDPALHVNGTYDLLAAPGVSFSYTVTGSGCAAISCHGGNDAVWGDAGSLSCDDCHLGTADVDNYSYMDGTQAKIAASQWTSTGHGVVDTAGYPVSGNSGAGLSCEYCHDGTVAHNEDTNFFRLANIGGADGMNGVCLVCHATGAAGFDPDGGATLPLLTASRKVDSYHYGTDHGTANNGGRFCWDCHDPHGDNNIYMVHDAVTRQSDGVNGIPTTTVTTSFTDHGTGTDFAQSTAPFTGICNVCHQTTSHYTATSGDGHNNGVACTTCHKHTGDTAMEAFAGGSCVDCHALSQDNGDGVPATGRRAVMGEFPTGNGHAHYGAVLSSLSCVVCHDQATHMDGYVDLFDADGNGTYRFVTYTDLTSDPDLSDFCASCHDADGATRLSSPLDPFGNGNQPPDVATRFAGTAQWNEWYGDDCFGSYEGSNRLVNSHHDISDADQSASGAKIECLDCHAAHTAAKSQPVKDPDTAVTAWDWANDRNGFCLACHDGGHGPTDPAMPATVQPPMFYTAPADPPANTPGTACGTGLLWDCADNCVDAATVTSATGDGSCNNSSGFTLNCAEFGNDGGDCRVNPCVGTDCSSLGGIDSCDYVTAPWHIDYSWQNTAHGRDSKRDWNGYAQTPPAPSYELDCVACHDAHGSNSANNPAGNLYMLRDVVDGTQYIDDGSLDGTQYQQPGVAGEVIIATPPSTGPNLAPLCSKCHLDWDNWGNFYHSNCSSCLTCHSHGAAWMNHDWVDDDDNVFCP